jgi:hypothetical protein
MLLAGVPDAFFGEGNARFYPSIIGLASRQLHG